MMDVATSDGIPEFTEDEIKETFWGQGKMNGWLYRRSAKTSEACICIRGRNDFFVENVN